MRILIVNDDGILAPGLAVAEEIAAAVAGPEGEVWVVAPETERSGVGHAISYAGAVLVTELGPRRFALSGFPADCTLIGLRGIMADAPPDLVLSGVNAGHNVAEDCVYSGTVGAAMEAALQGVRGIALSQFYNPSAGGDRFASARAQGAAAVRKALQCPWEKDLFYNINFPPQGVEEKGVTVAREGRREKANFDCEATDAPNRRRYFWLRHNLSHAETAPDSDATLCAGGWTTITPMRPRLEAADMVEAARAALGREA